MKYILSAFLALALGAFAFAQHHHTTVVVRPGAPANWKGVHHTRPVHVRPVAPVRGPRVVVANYHTVNGVRFRFGFFYNGFNHNHWSTHYWDTRYGAYLYYDPYATAWYYWCAPHFRFYPVTYAPLGYAFPFVPNPVAPAVPPPPPPVDDVAPPPPMPPVRD